MVRLRVQEFKGIFEEITPYAQVIKSENFNKSRSGIPESSLPRIMSNFNPLDKVSSLVDISIQRATDLICNGK